MAGQSLLFEIATVGKTWGFGGSPRVLASEGGPLNNALCYRPPAFNPLVGGSNPPRPTKHSRP